MASSGNEIERWAHRQSGRLGELVEPVTSPENGSGLSPVKLMGSVDHLLHLPGRVDSAYSSFSGGSNVPEYSTLLRSSENWCLPPEQVPYMDSEYVSGIYNLSAENSDLRCLHPYKAPDLSIHKKSHSTGLAECCGSTPTRGTLNQGPLALVAPPPSPPTRLDSYKVTRHLENSRGRHNSGSHGEYGVKDNQLTDRELPWRQCRDELTEQDTAAARGKSLENKGLSTDSANEVSISKIQGLKVEENGEWRPSQPIKRSNPHIFSRPSSFIFQEYLKTDSVSNVPKILSAYNSDHVYKITEEMNSKSHHPAHTNPNAVNDTQEDKQCPGGVRKPAFRAADLQSAVPEPSQRPGSLPCTQRPLRAELHSDMDQDVFEDSCDLKYMENAPLITNASRKLNSCTDENQCHDSEEKIGSHFREPLPNQQAKMQRSLLSCSYNAVEAGHLHGEESDQGNKQCCDNNSQMSFFRPNEDSTSQFLCEVKKEKQANKGSPDLSVALEQEEPPVQKYQAEFQKQCLRKPQDDLAGEQITRQTTPMLYYLSGGKPTNILHHNKPTQYQGDSRSSPKEFPASGCSASARCLEIQRESKQVQRTSHHHQGSADDLLPKTNDLILGSPASFMDDSFKSDYREKLKVAQKKVLRETSFKRKDLQMSLPVRLRQKPSKRPSIEHLRSFSLSSANEDAKPVPSSPSHLECLQSFSRDEEIKRPQAGRIGARKRVTKEQKKLCYSEPEKLDQLADKEVSWSQVRAEITEQDTVAAMRKTLENRGRALPSSGISRTELKQIQHTALIEYMERKINQRPAKRGGAAPAGVCQLNVCHGQVLLHLGELVRDQNRLLLPHRKKRWMLPRKSIVAISLIKRGRQNKAKKPTEAQTLVNLLGDLLLGSVSGDNKHGSKTKQLPRLTVLVAPVCCFHFQDTARCAAGAAVPARRCESCLGTPSFCDPEKDGYENHEYRDSDITGRARCQDAKELTPETPIPVPRSGSKEDAQVEEECRTKSLSGHALVKYPDQEPASSPERVACCHGAVAQPHQGDKNTAKGLTAKETSVHNSQSDFLPEGETNLPQRRLQSPEDQRYEELAMEIIAKDNSLVDVLIPHPLRKTALDLIEGLFPVDVSMLDKWHRKKGDIQHVQENDRKSSRDATEEHPESEQGAKQRSEDPASKGNKVLNRCRGSMDNLDDITSKKLELISSLRSKLQTLWEERELVLSEARECTERGEELQATVRDVCKPNEFERYMMFIGDLEKVVSLLLCLSSRLARVQNAMRQIDGNTDAEEKQSLNERHKLLSRQREDAKDLKENLDRRERVVSGILAKYLTEQQLQDYRRFVQVKTSLLIEQKDLEEQIKFFKEQLENLEKSIPL
ncbi:protein Shroom1 [Falco rusticolus]|uniref:protein Shroom1 n=1 Tax=Falco rusticolus TaxID=120794 RepID=UPI00188659BE|nr:protein Shroom1 [Falco rusticolus]